MPIAAIAIPALISAGAGIAGGLISRSASGQAARYQYQASQQAIQEMRDQLAKYLPPIGTTAEQAATDVLGAGQAAQAGLGTAAQQGQQMVLGAGQQANQFLQPYMQLGGGAATTLADLMAPGGDLSRNFTVADMATMDPGYQFRIDQANQALAASAAARGGALGGGAAKALARYSQDVASGELGNAFDRFRAMQQDRFNRLSSITDLGARVSNLAGGNLIDTSKYAGTLGTQAAQQIGQWGLGANQWAGAARTGAAQSQADLAMQGYRTIADLITGGANAQAAGAVGQGNALGGIFGNIANIAGGVGGYMQLKNLLNPTPSTTINPQLYNLPGPTMYNNPAINPTINPYP